MGAQRPVAPLVAIIGQTGSGKSALAMRLAEHFGGEIIAADSRTVYAGMDIGTAKPTPAERARIRHFALDVVTPGQLFNAYDFKQVATEAIADISARGRLPFLVGGTGLYIDAVVFNYAFRSAPDPSKRAELESLSVAELQRRIVSADLPMPKNSQNSRHLIRVLESGTILRQARQLRPNTLLLGLQPPADQLRSRLLARAEAMLATGLEAETKQLITEYGEAEALRTPAYSAVLAYLRGHILRTAISETIVANDLKLAKRQRTWFRRNSLIHWLNNRDNFAESVELITTLLNK